MSEPINISNTEKIKQNNLDQIEIRDDQKTNEKEEDNVKNDDSSSKSKPVALEYWENRKIKELYHPFCDRLSNVFNHYSWHSTAKYVQHKSRSYLLEILPNDTLLLALDYIQNVVCAEHNTTFDAYQKSVECSYLQLNVLWKENKQLKHASFQIISSDSKHDTSSAIAALNFWFSRCWYLWNDFSFVECWTDNSPKEFGSNRFVRCLLELGREYSFQVSKNFSAIYDGKYFCDNEGSINKGHVSRGIRSGKVNFVDQDKTNNADYHASEIVRYLNEVHWIKRNETAMPRCAMTLPRRYIKHSRSIYNSFKHFQTHHCFRQISQSIRLPNHNTNQKDNTNANQASNQDDNNVKRILLVDEVLMRLLTCYCPYCVSGEYVDAENQCVHNDTCGPWKRLKFTEKSPKKPKQNNQRTTNKQKNKAKGQGKPKANK